MFILLVNILGPLSFGLCIQLYLIGLLRLVITIMKCLHTLILGKYYIYKSNIIENQNIKIIIIVFNVFIPRFAPYDHARARVDGMDIHLFFISQSS